MSNCSFLKGDPHELYRDIAIEKGNNYATIFCNDFLTHLNQHKLRQGTFPVFYHEGFKPICLSDTRFYKIKLIL